MPDSLPARHLSCAIDTAAGTVRLDLGGRTIAGVLASAVISPTGDPTQVRTLSLLAAGTVERDQRGSRQRLTVRVDHGIVVTEWSITHAAGDAVMEIAVSIHAQANGWHIDRITPFQVAWSSTPLAEHVAAARWWIGTASGWDAPGTRPLAGPDQVDDCRSVAFDVGAAFEPSGRAMTLSHGLPVRWINRIDADSTQVAVISSLGVDCPAGTTVRSDPLRLDAVQPILVALGDAGARHRSRRPPEDSRDHWGYNTWDFYVDKITERDLPTIISAITAHPWMKQRLRYLIIDDGWQDTTGDWKSGDRFGSMERAAQTIAAAGFVPGLWSAPFMVDRHSETMRLHPEYALHVTDGQLFSHCMGCDPPWGDRCYLDPTHPGVWEHCFTLYRRLYNWGFRYFKTDFLTNAIGSEFPGEQAKYQGKIVYHDPHMGLVRAHRACMEAIRAAIGPDSFWLGCGSHYASGAGLMDASRMSGDIRVFYPNLLGCARSAIFNFYMHGGGFLIDPDFAVFRGRETILPGGLELPSEGTVPYDRQKGNSGPTFNLAEARLWAAVILMCGGLVTLSDRIDGLNAAGLAVIRTLLEHGGGPAALPIDIFESIPRLWRKQRGAETYLLLANWDDGGIRHISLSADCGIADGTELRDLWTQERWRFHSGLSFDIPPHGHRLLHAVRTD